MNHANVLIKPIITEKSIAESKNGVYTFLVNSLSTKEDVKNAMKKVLGVNAVRVRMIRYRDHKRRINYTDPSKGSNKRKTINYKKAVVKLAADEKLDYFDID